MSLNNQNIKGADEMIAKLKQAQQYILHDVPQVVGTEAVKHFKQSFQDEGFTDTNLVKWATRKTKSNNSKKTLMKSNELVDSIDFRIQGTTIIIYSDKLYAQIHNEGGKIAVTPKMKKFFWAMSIQAKNAGDIDQANQYKYMALAKEITIVQRKFIGNSVVMNEKIVAKINRDLTRILNL